MSSSDPRRIVFVAPSFTGESLRSARAVASLENVVLLGICEAPADTNDATMFAEIIRVDDANSSEQLPEAARRLQHTHGPLNQIVTTHETLLEPVAETSEALGLEGMSVATVRRALNKSSLIATLRDAGIGTARNRIITSDLEARTIRNEFHYPIIVKPLTGSGGLATWSVRNDQQLALALELTNPSVTRPLLIEECLDGEELCFDTITIANEPRFYSICCYRPSILEALEDPSVQWRCLMPRDISDERYREFIKQGLAAVRALSAGNAMTHMEGFRLDDGRICFTDATLRPAGARIAPMLGHAYDVDPYRAWARSVLDGCFDGPWTRKFAVGTIFLRGKGSGTVERVRGAELVEQKLGDLLVDVRLPRTGAAKASTYTGDGYLTVRHPETDAVETALDFISQTIQIDYSGPEPASPALATTVKEEWRKRLQYNQLYKPAWEIDSHTRNV